MFHAENMTINDSVIYKNYYTIFPYPLRYSQLFDSEAVLNNIMIRYPFLNKGTLMMFSNEDIIKVPNYQIIKDYVLKSRDAMKKNITNSNIKRQIDRKANDFLDKFYGLYLPHTQVLTDRVIRLNNLINRKSTMSMIKNEQRLCITEAILMLAFVKVCIPDFTTMKY